MLCTYMSYVKMLCKYSTNFLPKIVRLAISTKVKGKSTNIIYLVDNTNHNS